MRIAIDCRCLVARPEIPLDGAGRYALNLVRSLLDLDTRNEYTVYVTQEQVEQTPLRPVVKGRAELRGLPLSHMDLSQHWQLRRLVAEDRPDVYHYCSFDLPALGPPRCVFTVHDTNPLLWRGFYARGDALKRRWARWLVSRGARHSEMLVSSEATRFSLISALPHAAARTRVVHLGIDPADHKACAAEQAEAARERWGLGSRPIVLNLGTNRPHKNLPRLIEAFGTLRTRERVEAQLVLAGFWYDRFPGATEALERSGLQDEVKVLGHVGDDDVAALYTLADVVAVISLSEGFGFPVLEAMCHGTPVVGSRGTAVAEIGGPAIESADPRSSESIAEALKRVLTDPGLAEELRRAGHERVKAFPWRRTAEATLEAYRDVAGRSA